MQSRRHGSCPEKVRHLLSHKFLEICTMYSIVSVCTRFGVHDTGYSLSPPLFSHSCLAKARARQNESERKPLVSLRLSDAVSLRRTHSVPSRSPLRPERSEKRTLGIRVAVHSTGYSPVPTSEYIRRQYCMYKINNRVKSTVVGHRTVIGLILRNK